MARIEIQLFGLPTISVDGTPITLNRRKAICLLAYLVAAGVRQSREHLATLLWPDNDNTSALANLRHQLYILRRNIDDSLFSSSGAGIEIGDNVASDIQEYESCIHAVDTCAHIELAQCDNCRLSISRAISIYQDDFLKGFTSSGSAEFDNWQSSSTESYRRSFIWLLSRLAYIHEQCGETERAIEVASRWQEIDFLDEGAHRALMRLYARAGRRSQALRQYEMCSSILRTEIGTEPDEETWRLFQTIQQKTQAMPALKASESHRITEATAKSSLNNLPAQLTSLIGREKEIANISSLLSPKNERLLTLSGPAGVGKTRLALQVGLEMLEEVEHGVFFVDLSVTNEPERVASIIAQTLDVREGMGENRPLAEILKDHLKSKLMLLILDNFEQVVEAGSFVAELLASSPELVIIVTSREPLRVRGEREFPVMPLSLPIKGNGLSVEKITQYESARLFIDRAVAVKPDFSVTDENAQAVAEICIRLDGLPLAIELAAARIKILPPRALARRLTDRLRLLKGGARDLPARQRTLRSAIDWSYDLLDEDEKRLFVRLSVFSGGCTLEAAEAVCTIGDEWDFDVINGLASLVDKSLVRQTDTGGEPRFRMLETVGEYSRDKLEGTGYGDTVRSNHAQYFLELAEEADPKLRGPDQMTWLDRLETEYANLGAAIERHLKRDMTQEALRMTGALYWFWYRFGHFTDGRKWAKQALAQADKATPTRAHAGALNAQCYLEFCAGRTNININVELYRKSVMLCRKVGDKKELVFALSGLGLTESWKAGSYVGKPYVEESISIARDAADPWVIGYALWLSHVASVAGTVEEMYLPKECEEAVVMFRKAGDFWGTGSALQELGDVYERNGEYGKARPLFEQSLEKTRAAKDRFQMHNVLRHLGQVCFNEKAYRQAAKYRKKALRIAYDLGSIRNLSWLIYQLGQIATVEGDHAKAARLSGAYNVMAEDYELGIIDIDVVAETSHHSENYPAEYAEGRAMTLAQAVEYALVSESTGNEQHLI